MPFQFIHFQIFLLIRQKSKLYMDAVYRVCPRLIWAYNVSKHLTNIRIIRSILTATQLCQRKWQHMFLNDIVRRSYSSSNCCFNLDFAVENGKYRVRNSIPIFLQGKQYKKNKTFILLTDWNEGKGQAVHPSNTFKSHILPSETKRK